MKNFFKKISLVASAALAFAFCFGGLTFADGSEAVFETNKAYIDFGELSELGRSYTQEFRIRNNSDEEQKVVASIASYENGNVSNDFKIADEWLVFVDGQNEFTVPANGETAVKVRVHLPNTVKAGSYYATVKLNDSSETFKTLDVRMDILGDGFSRSGSLGGNYARAVSLGGKIQAGAVVKNSGSSGFVSTYTLKKGEAFGLEHFEEIVSETREVPAGTELKFDASEYTENLYGIYKLEQTVTYVNGNGELIESTLKQTVINLPWLSVFIAGGVVFAIIVLIVVISILRKKHNKAED